MAVEPHDFETWYRSNHARLVAALLLVSGNLDLTRDSVDEACTRAFARWDRVRRMESPGGWTYRVALHALRRRQRRAALEHRLLARAAPAEVIPPPAGEAWAAVRDLPPRQRTAVVLRYVADLTQIDIAAVMGITRSTVSSLLADAHAHLAEVIAPDPVDMESHDG
jgi:RNA polymerase sigma-70 factor (ECF subfamily)